LLDISAAVPAEMLEKYGVKTSDAILAQDQHLPVFQDLIANYDVQYLAGGATQNSIRVAQWMLQTPGATSYICCVGNDAFGEQLRKCAEADGVRTFYLQDEELATGTCACLIVDHERSLIAHLSAANKYKIAHLLGADIEPVWQNARLFYSAGFFLTVSPDSMLHLARHAMDTGKTYCANLSAPFITQFFSEPLLALLPYVDIIFGNESEAESFGTTMGYEDKSPAAVALKLAALPSQRDRPRIAIVTQGAQPTFVATEGKLSSFPVPPVADIVDVNGAGDAFVGGFLSQFIQGKDLAVCVAAAHYAASVILRVSGTVLSGQPNFR